ncbi:MAG: hypothetical protein EP329_19775 [Deltaproteobacteria bacterium]|nr:MAG: hypothetical protein EP329_19775 [Deltaproteobacteria bacterium]
MRASFLALPALALTLFAACPPTDDGDPEPTPTPEPTACGARLGATCGAGEFCLFEEDDHCGWADATGTCQPLPELCYSLYAPVCACDGNVYSNDCVAHAAGTSVLHAIEPAVAGDVVGDWSGTAPGGWTTEWSFGQDGTLTKTDLIAPCPEGVACVWSGVVVNHGTWSMSMGAVALSYQNPSNMAGATTPSYLNTESDCDGVTLTETGPTGAHATYTLD